MVIDFQVYLQLFTVTKKKQLIFNIDGNIKVNSKLTERVTPKRKNDDRKY